MPMGKAMEHLLERLLARPDLEHARMAGAAVRGPLRQDPRRVLQGLASWSAHPNPWVRVASGFGYATAATLDRNALGDVLPFVERLANDTESEVRRHGAQDVIEQLWAAHPDALETVAEQWMRSKNDLVREVVVRAVAAVATGGQIRRPSILRRFIQRGLALFDLAVPGCSPSLRTTMGQAVDALGSLAPEIVVPFLREWAQREEANALRLVTDVSKLPVAALCDGVDFEGATARLRKAEARRRIETARWVHKGIGAIDYAQVVGRELLVPRGGESVPWTHAADPYRGCQLRCEFCSTRSLSEWSGDDAETFTRRVTVVRNAAELLARALDTAEMQPRDRHVLVLGLDSDPYQPAEESYEVVRDLLKTCLTIGHPVVIQTRQSLVTRDLDVLEAMAEHGLVNVLFGLQTAVDGIRTRLEAGTSSCAERFRAIGMLARKDVPVGVLLSPVMPELTDDPELLEEALRRAGESGARWAVAETLHMRGSAGVKVRLFLESFVASLVPRYDALYGPDGRPTEECAAWAKRITGEVLPPILARHGLTDTSKMLTGGKDPAALLVR